MADDLHTDFDDLEALDGRTLQDAFRVLVLQENDPWALGAFDAGSHAAADWFTEWRWPVVVDLGAAQDDRAKVLGRFQRLIECFQFGRILANGAIDAGGVRRLITNDEWRAGALSIDIRANQLGRWRGDTWEPVFSDIRIYGRDPFDVGYLHDCQLKRGFVAYVLRQPEPAEKIKAARAAWSGFPQSDTELLKLWPETGVPWFTEAGTETVGRWLETICGTERPAPGRDDDPRRFALEKARHETGRPLDEVREAYQAIFERYVMLMDRLEKGHLVAVGYAVSNGVTHTDQEIHISRGYFEHSECGLMIRENTLVKWGRDRHGREWWHPIYEMVRFYFPKRDLPDEFEPKADAKPEPADQPADPSAKPKNKGGRPSAHAWDKAFEELVIVLGEEGLPNTGAQLAEMYLDALQKVQGTAPSQEQAKKHLRENYKRLWKHIQDRRKNGDF